MDLVLWIDGMFWYLFDLCSYPVKSIDIIKLHYSLWNISSLCNCFQIRYRGKAWIINIRHNFFTSFNVGIVDGMSIIDLGCGWGSVSIYLASKFPKCKITSVSNSHSQKVFILARAAERGYKNISVYTGEQIFNLFDNFILKYFLSSFICHEICLVTNDVYRYQHP